MKSKMRITCSLVLLSLFVFLIQPAYATAPTIQAPLLSHEHIIKHYFDRDGGIEIENGLSFQIRNSDRAIVSRWPKSSRVIIYTYTPWISWSSQFKYQIVNQYTGETVLAELTRPASLASPANHLLYAMDLYTGVVTIVLQGSTNPSEFQPGSEEYFQVNSMDKEGREQIKKWLQSDNILVIKNDKWFQGSYEYVLVNTSIKPESIVKVCKRERS